MTLILQQEERFWRPKRTLLDERWLDSVKSVVLDILMLAASQEGVEHEKKKKTNHEGA